ncbi:hypothetical protein DRO03_10250, partial [Methanosarcinales archaeon]
EDLVEYNGDQVQNSGVDVVNSVSIRQAVTREVSYVSILSLTPTIKTTFAYYWNEEFSDWRYYEGGETYHGVDAPAHLLTGYIGNGDYQRNKQIPYIFFHFRRTESGLIQPTVPDGEDIADYPMVLAAPSSCLVSAQWDWTTSANAGKWGRQFQAYRYRRKYLGVDVNDPYDTGFATVVSKSKLRGSGKVVSLLLESEPEKDLDLLGWSLTLGSNEDV